VAVKESWPSIEVRNSPCSPQGTVTKSEGRRGVGLIVDYRVAPNFCEF